ncbi:MAG TPA: macro domain-containing protein [Coriobacteriia bacterium]
MPISLQLGDITRVEADAIVNAANTMLAPGGGVCGAIHSAGGPAIVAECVRAVAHEGPVRTGNAVATTAGRLPARHVIHAVGPVWHGGRSGEEAALASAYARSVEVADGLGLTSVAFPSIATGIYGYPVELAAPVAVAAVSGALAAASHVRDVVFVLYDEATYAAFRAALDRRDV